MKALEERLKQVETLLNSKEPSISPAAAPTSAPPVSSHPTVEFDVLNAHVSLALDRDVDCWRHVATSPQQAMEDMAFDANMAGMTMGMDDTIAPTMRPPIALRYAMWTLAASITDKYTDLKDQFYQRSRKYVEVDETKGHGEHMITVAHSQTHTLLASCEFKMMYFPRAWMSTGKAVRLAQMMGLHRFDGVGLDVKQCLPAARDWTETEERRRSICKHGHRLAHDC